MSIAGDMTLINAYEDDPEWFKGYTKGLRRAYELTHDEQVLAIKQRGWRKTPARRVLPNPGSCVNPKL